METSLPPVSQQSSAKLLARESTTTTTSKSHPDIRTDIVIDLSKEEDDDKEKPPSNTNSKPVNVIEIDSLETPTSSDNPPRRVIQSKSATTRGDKNNHVVEDVSAAPVSMSTLSGSRRSPGKSTAAALRTNSPSLLGQSDRPTCDNGGKSDGREKASYIDKTSLSCLGDKQAPNSAAQTSISASSTGQTSISSTSTKATSLAGQTSISAPSSAAATTSFSGSGLAKTLNQDREEEEFIRLGDSSESDSGSDAELSLFVDKLADHRKLSPSQEHTPEKMEH